ncbi:5-deoxy-glucuronate isomerase [Staphylococcus lutrae]|uniref:5-deoxy-glucuronate isomerase n=1 Tax=Staphylococcus lutrae TaxID=155085 RepID=A0AAC9WJ70_9STAP|nr:5-deoxy-glucuronate isomerase [Staphylococcus lutrae]ARJ50718.1 5-deoxy-glucuronate isomerase [Staphylococcus lutrae]PNZ34766.1 5-deoxy-glucuronate isomerase [Staphylococcus lutrae]
MSHLLRKATQTQQDVSFVHRHQMDDLGLQYIGFEVMDLTNGAEYTFETKEYEVCLVVHTGKVNVTIDGQVFNDLGRRTSAFDKIPTDSLYASRDRDITIKAVNSATVIVCYSKCRTQRPTYFIRAEENTTEHRGKYANQRYVQNILPDDHHASEHLLVVEVYTDQGNWSSYPPHKHDVDDLPNESLLEEIYYHEMNPRQGFVFQRVYTDDQCIDETMTVENRDVVIVPKGYHPVGVPDGYDSYYLNVMAGPKKVWKFNNAKEHEWIIDRE